MSGAHSLYCDGFFMDWGTIKYLPLIILRSTGLMAYHVSRDQVFGTGMTNFTENKTLHRFQVVGMALMVCAFIVSVTASIIWLVSPEHDLIAASLMLSALLALFGFIILAWRVIFGYRGEPE